MVIFTLLSSEKQWGRYSPFLSLNVNYIFIFAAWVSKSRRFKGTVKEKWKGEYDETWESQALNDTYKISIWCSCIEKLIWNCVKLIRKFIDMQFCVKVVLLNSSYSIQIGEQSENDNIPQEPENLRFVPVIIFFILHF